MKRTIRCQVEPVLGTRLDLLATFDAPRFVSRLAPRSASTEKLRARIEQVALAEIDRLSAVFSVYDPISELRRWRADAVPGSRAVVSEDLAGLLSLSARWQVQSNGAYDPAIGIVFDRWKAAAESGVVPSVTETDEWAARIGSVAYVVDGTTVECIGDCTGLTFNSLAKGLIADRTLTVCEVVDGFIGGMVNLGGDIAIRNHSTTVGIEHPTRPYDNEPPLCVLTVSNGGVATSSGSRRPILIGTESFSHLIDPRTCRPVPSDRGSVTVIAESAASADVLATIVSVTGELIPDVAMAIAMPSGKLRTTPMFDALSERGCHQG